MNLKEFVEKYGNQEVEEAKLKELLGIEDSKVWKPRHGKRYWWVHAFGDIYQGVCANTISDKYLYSLGNCYKTEEEAIFARDKQIFMTKLERDFEENSEELNWKSAQPKYSLYIIEDIIKTDFYTVVGLGVPVTTNKEWLENYIRENEADIKKYYFGKGE